MTISPGMAMFSLRLYRLLALVLFFCFTDKKNNAKSNDRLGLKERKKIL